MSRRFFTADFHLGDATIWSLCRSDQFQTLEDMNKSIVNMCNSIADYDDVIVHCGDFCKFSNTKADGLKVNPNAFIRKHINATLINVVGNHDACNKVKSLCNSMRITLGKYKDVSVSHYPSYDTRARNAFKIGDIHLCGHVHEQWKHCLDLTHKVLNINVGLDAWYGRILTEDKIIEYIDKLMKLPTDMLNKVIVENGKLRTIFYNNNQTSLTTSNQKDIK